MFVSHAQNFEDVVLWRALAPFGPGFYIDVGAADPTYDSVTKAFYDAGWRGINVEPMPDACALLRRTRRRDVNLQLALEDHVGTAVYFSIGDGNGLSTGDSEIASRHAALGWPVEETTVDVETLASVCERFVNSEIHFLKIDVEGLEDRVLRGADFTRYRPWIVVVEAVAPRSLPHRESDDSCRSDVVAQTHESWEPQLIDCGYEFVLFDGLNRFYVAKEKATLLGPALSTPANVLDGFVRADEVRELDALTEARDRLQEACDVLRVSLEAAEQVAEQEVGNSARLEVLIAELNVRVGCQSAAVEALQQELEATLQTLWESSRQVGALAADLQRAEDDWHHAAAHGEALASELDAVYATRAWRLTKPLRIARARFRRSRAAT